MTLDQEFEATVSNCLSPVGHGSLGTRITIMATKKNIVHGVLRMANILSLMASIYEGRECTRKKKRTETKMELTDSILEEVIQGLG